MTSRHTRKGIYTGITIAGLLAATIGMADINDSDQNADKTANEASPLETKKLKLEKLNHADLVNQLANENFFIRELATKIAWERGKPVLSALEQGLLSGNPELISRASGLISLIKTGITPDTPPETKRLMEAFKKANNLNKKAILKRMYAAKDYSYMLYMLSEMKNKNVALNFHADFPDLTKRAAQQAILKGKVETAIELLKSAPKSNSTLRSLAYLYALTGKLDAELEKLEKMDGQLVDKEWLKHLNLERSNRADIRKFAESKKLEGVIASLDLLEGNPDKTLQYYSDQAPLTSKTGLAILKAQYDGNSEKFIKNAHIQQEKNLKLSMDDEQPDTANQIIKSMSLTGARAIVEPYLYEKHRYESFSYLVYKEQPNKALKVIGITDDESLQKFIKENTQLAIDALGIHPADKSQFRGAEQLSYSDRLVDVAEFYYSKGLQNKTKDVIKPLLKALQEKKHLEWYKIVESISNKGMSDLAVELVLDRGNDDETYEKMVVHLYSDSDDINLIWDTLLNREGIAPEKSFRDLALVMGVYQGEVEARLQLQKDLIAISTKQDEANLYSMRSALRAVAIYKQDVISERQYAKQLLDAEKGEARTPQKKLDYLRSLLGCLDWQGIITLLDKDRSLIEDSPMWYAVYSIAKRKMGDEKEADNLLNYAKLISIGIEEDLGSIAWRHHLAGYDNIFIEILERMLIVHSADRGSRYYKNALGYLSEACSAYMNDQQWAKVAAIFTVNCASRLIQEPASSEHTYVNYYTREFYRTQFCRGMELYQAGEKAKGLKMLTSAHEAIVGDATLADYFYAAIRTTDLTEQYDLWVEESYQHLKRSLDEFPDSANTHNSLGWVLSRAVRKIDLGIEHSKKSLKLIPLEAAYLDTMAELWYAKGDRKKAIEWGEKAVFSTKSGRLDKLGRRSSMSTQTSDLSNQLERFKTEPHPKADFSNN